MRQLLGLLLALVALTALAGALFFGYYGLRLVHLVVTHRGEGSLGHVGMYVGAVLLPLLALGCGSVAWFAGRAAKVRLTATGPTRR